MPENQKTLIICPIGLGNFIMMTPAMEHHHRHLGRENLHLLSLKPSIRQMGEAAGYFGAIHHWDPDSESLARGLAVLRVLRRERYRRLVSLFPSPNRMGNIYAWLTGTEERIGFQYPHSRLPAWLHTTTIPLDLTAHDVEEATHRAWLAAAPGNDRRLCALAAARATRVLDAKRPGILLLHPAGRSIQSRSPTRSRAPSRRRTTSSATPAPAGTGEWI